MKKNLRNSILKSTPTLCHLLLTNLMKNAITINTALMAKLQPSRSLKKFLLNRLVIPWSLPCLSWLWSPMNSRRWLTKKWSSNKKTTNSIWEILPDTNWKCRSFQTTVLWLSKDSTYRVRKLPKMRVHWSRRISHRSLIALGTIARTGFRM